MAETVDVKAIGQRLGKKTYEQLKPHLELVYMKIALDIYNMLAELTPVDTGYLKLSLTTVINGEPSFVPDAKDPNAKTGAYVGAAAENVARQQEALLNFQLGDVLDIGYTANYAVYVNDRVNMVEQTQSALKGIVRRAFQEAKKGLS